MRLVTVAVALAFLAPVMACAQQSPQGAPVVIDRDLWTSMNSAIVDTSMPLPAHQRIQQILQNVEREAMERAARAAAAAKPKEEQK